LRQRWAAWYQGSLGHCVRFRPRCPGVRSRRQCRKAVLPRSLGSRSWIARVLANVNESILSGAVSYALEYFRLGALPRAIAQHRAGRRHRKSEDTSYQRPSTALASAVAHEPDLECCRSGRFSRAAGRQVALCVSAAISVMGQRSRAGQCV